MLGRIVHLASCSLGARSTDLDAALTRMLEAMAEHGAPWHSFEEETSEARRRFATLIGARPDQIAVVPNASVGAYQVASTLPWARRPRLVTTVAEFPSVAHVWLAQRPRGAEVVYVGERDGAVAAADYLAAIDERTGLVSIPLTTYRNGARLPVADVVRAAHAAGARVFVDAYQAVGVEPVDAVGLGCDYLVAGTMKYLLGLPGVAFLYVRLGSAGDLAPQLTGWFGRADPFALDPQTLDFPDEARRFETGTPAVPALYAANAGLGLIGRLDLAAVRRHVATLVAYCADRLTDQGERVWTPAEPAARGAHIALADPDPAALADWLALRGIAVSPRGDVLRLAFHYYNNADDVDRVCEAITRYRRAPTGAHSLFSSGQGKSGPQDQVAQKDAEVGQPGTLETWLVRPDSDAFPYDAVLKEYLRVGKHFVSTELLETLARVRSVLREGCGAAPSFRLLGRFLDAALDKADGRYDYVTYLALDLLPLPAADDPGQDTAPAERQCDRLVVQLVSDALRFELAAADGKTELLPEMRPGARTTSKRCRLGLRAVAPALARLGLNEGLVATDPVAAARRVCADVEADLSPGERRTLQLSMLPVYVVHDEWMFIRVLQSFETTFALLAVQLRAAMTALAQGVPVLAGRHLREAEAALRQGTPLFWLLATMQVDAFRTFRVYTEGASAIQSRNYKIVESLCRTPDRARLDSIAYHSVPEVRDWVLAGQATLDGAFEAACAADRLTSAERDGLDRAMRQFSATLMQWRQTHYRLAVRMLGERSGTGYTEGTPYLKAVRTIPVFRSVDTMETTATRDLPKDEEAAHALSPGADPSVREPQ